MILVTFLGDGRIDGFIHVSGLIDGYWKGGIKVQKNNLVVLRSYMF